MAEQDEGATEGRANGADEAAPEPNFEALLLRSGFNYHVFLAGAFGFGREQGASPRQFVDWMAERLGQGWRGLRGHGSDAVLNVILENLASTGYPIHEVEFGDEVSRAKVGTIPLGMDGEQWRQLLEPFAVTPHEMHALFQVFVPLAETAGTTLQLEGFRDQLRLTVRRNAASRADEPEGPEER